jgi:phosphoglucomutase
MPLTDKDYHDMDMADALVDIRTVRKLIGKLKVDELRVLASKYWKMDRRELKRIGKAELIDVLSTENAGEILDDMWKHRK